MLPLLLVLSPVFAQDCGSTNVALIHDVSAAAMTEWSSTVYDALRELTGAANMAQAKEDAHEVADRVRAAQEEGSISPADAAKLLDAMSYLWNRADELEKGWASLIEGDFDSARDRASQVADRIRQAADQGYLCEEQKTALLSQAWRLWNLADGLAKAEAAQGEEAEDKAHATVELARQYGRHDQITDEQQAAVEEHAGRIHQVDANATNPEGSKGIVDRVPYFNQYDNGINGGGSCQNTSVAMVLSFYGVNIQPDTISASSFGTNTAKTPSGAARVFNHYAAQAGIPQRMTGHFDGSFHEMKAELDRGHPVVINGYFTAGHVLVVTGYDDDGYYVNDPAGEWNERFMGGYAGQPYDGRGVHYDEAAFEQAVGTWENGVTAAPLYYTTIE